MSASSRPTSKTKPAAQKTSRRSTTDSAQDQTQGARIEFETIQDYDGYVTGAARYQDRDGLGEFAVNVSGTREAILKYAEQARILRLQIVPLERADRKAMAEQRRAATAYWRTVWQDRLKRLRKVVNESSPELLADPDKLWQTARDLERAETGRRPKLDWAYDQLIEIKSEGDLPKGEGYAFSLQIDPKLGPFEAHSYSLQNTGVWYLNQVQGSVWAGETRFSCWTGLAYVTYRGVTVAEYAGGNAYYSISVNGVFFA